jgi:HK97 family phage major capsid protein
MSVTVGKRHTQIRQSALNINSINSGGILMLTQQQKNELDSEILGIVDSRVQAQLRKTINKRFSPGNAGEKPKESKYFVNTNSEYSSTIKFFHDVMVASSEGGQESDELRSYVKKTSTLMEEGDLSQGGYAIPTEASSRILERSLETSIIRPRATAQPMSSNKLEIPADVDENHSTNYWGGITIYRTGEGNQKTGTNPVIGKIGLTLHKLTGYCEVTDELLEDAPALEAWLIRKFASSIAFVEDNDFLTGSGANMALGMFSSANPSLITADAETGQGASTIVAENIASMWSRLYPAGQANAIWIANINCFKQLFHMGISVGLAGVPVWMPGNQLSGKPYKELLGQPIFFSEKMQSLGTAGDLGLCDPTQYIVGDRNGGVPQIASSIHVKFDYDRTAFRFVLRYDGQPSWLSTLTPKNGTETLSPFIVLSGTRT